MQIDGRLHRKSTGQKDYDLAQKVARDFERNARESDAGYQKMPTWGEWVQRYLDGEAKNKKGACERDPKLLAFSLRQWKTRKLDSIRRSDCEALLGARLAMGGAPGTVWLECIRIKFLFQLAIYDKLLRDNPWGQGKKAVKLPKAASRTRVLRPTEEVLLRQGLAPEWQRMLTVMLGTGLRRSELTALCPRLLVHDRTFIRVPTDIAKNGKERLIPIRPEVLAALAGQIPESEWESRSGALFWPYHHATPTEVIRNAARAVGINGLTLHDLRRTFGTRCAEAGMPLTHLQKIMGHSNSAVTMTYYVKIGNESLLDALLKLKMTASAPVPTPPVTTDTKEVTEGEMVGV
jgi:integrase